MLGKLRTRQFESGETSRKSGSRKGRATELMAAGVVTSANAVSGESDVRGRFYLRPTT